MKKEMKIGEILWILFLGIADGIFIGYMWHIGSEALALGLFAGLVILALLIVNNKIEKLL